MTKLPQYRVPFSQQSSSYRGQNGKMPFSELKSLDRFQFLSGKKLAILSKFW